MLITQPCNYVSNVAYYYSASSLCQKYKDFTIPRSTVLMLASSFFALGSGSAFFHGSGTMLGCRIDNAPISQIAIASHQASVGSLEPGPVVWNAMPSGDVGEETLDGVEVIKRFNQLFLGDILGWDQAILDLNENFQDDYKVTFSCIVTTIARITLPKRLGTVLLKFLCAVFG